MGVTAVSEVTYAGTSSRQLATYFAADRKSLCDYIKLKADSLFRKRTAGNILPNIILFTKPRHPEFWANHVITYHDASRRVTLVGQ